jgi:hypothetical protein
VPFFARHWKTSLVFVVESVLNMSQNVSIFILEDATIIHEANIGWLGEGVVKRGCLFSSLHPWCSFNIAVGESCEQQPVKAAEGRTPHNNGWNGANGMASNTRKPRVWCIWYHSNCTALAVTKLRYHQPPVTSTVLNVSFWTAPSF